MDFWKFLLWGVILFIIGNLVLWLVRFFLIKSGTTFHVESALSKLFPAPVVKPT